MHIEMTNPANLTRTELEQESCKIAAIAAAYGPDESEIYWDEQPAIIADAAGNILDGHHRHAAFLSLGYSAVRVLFVDDDFAQMADEIGLQAAVREVANEIGCPYTWASA
jgi:hypothetical protein